jgi:hypothetical protein
MSHGGTYAGWFGATKRVAGLILNDAGIGRERAGLAGILLLEKLGVPGATLAHTSARIGDGADGAANGIVSFANAPARKLGLADGMTAREALDRLVTAKLASAPLPPAEDEHRQEIAGAGAGGMKVIAMDSISLVSAADTGHVAVTGSHGGILGGKPETAIKHDVSAIVCNDAGFGRDAAGVSRLAPLDERRIAAACVSNFSARIGDGMSIWEHGYVSIVNETARRRGGFIGQSCKEFVRAMVATAAATAKR